MTETDQIINIENNSLLAELGSQERPLIERWVSGCLPAFEMRNRLAANITNNDGMQVPDFLIPVIKLWAEMGPIILCSYSHPEQFDFYKFVGQLNLIQFVRRMRANGFDIPVDRITENWYETVALDRSVTEPLVFGDIFTRDKIKADILGLSNRKFGSENIDFEKQRGSVSSNERQVPQLAQVVVDKLVQELDDTLKEKMPNLTRRQRHDTRQGEIKDLIARRLFCMVGIVDIALDNLSLRPKPSVNDLLFEVEQRFGGLIFDGRTKFGSIKRLSEVTGIEGKLSSKNQKYFDLVMDSLDLLKEARGVGILKNLVNSTGDGLFLGFIDGRDLALTVDRQDNSFILMNSGTGETERKLPDAEVLKFVRENNFVPLAKAETLALVAGGMTFHMGSEHGNRDRAIAVLGLKEEGFGRFADYLASLRIGQDLEQGNRLFLLDGTKPIPAILAFVLFGERDLRQMLMDKVGISPEPSSVTDREVKQMAADSLVENFSAARARNSSLSLGSMMHAGYLWG